MNPSMQRVHHLITCQFLLKMAQSISSSSKLISRAPLLHIRTLARLLRSTRLNESHSHDKPASQAKAPTVRNTLPLACLGQRITLFAQDNPASRIYQSLRLRTCRSKSSGSNELSRQSPEEELESQQWRTHSLSVLPNCVWLFGSMPRQTRCDAEADKSGDQDKELIT
jgi:hypothetical protein